MRRCNDIYEIVTVYYPSSCFTTTKCPTTTTTTTTQAPLSLKLTFDDIANANALVGDAYNVTDWNTFFDLPTYGNPFTSVEIVGNEVNLMGGSNIILKDSLFGNSGQGNSLLEIIDNIGCIISAGYDVFGDDNGEGCGNLITVNLPVIITAGNYCFRGCILLLNLSLPLLEVAGEGCFTGCQTITQFILPSLATLSPYLFRYCVSVSSFSNLEILLTTVNLPDACFLDCRSLVSIHLPNVLSIGVASLAQCYMLETISIPVCVDLGGTIENNQVFTNIIGNTINLTIPSALMTCNGGLPDGDIQYLQANNTVTIITT